jgi:hypothetical protein
MSSSGSPLSFLFQGTTPAQGTNYSQNQSNVPTWLQEYTQGILAQANSIAAQPYQTYGGPRIAPFTQQQTQAQNEVQNIQGQYQPTLTQAQQMATTGSNPSAISGALGYLPQAQGMIQSALAPTAAQMNPYAQNVIGQAETQAQQFWQNQLQPSIDQQYAAAGQSGSSADLRAQEEQANQLTEGIQATGNAALGQAYTAAQNAGLQGAQLTGALGQIGGGLGYEQGVLGLQGAGTLGSLAQTGQQLGLQGAGALDTTGGEQQNLNQQNLSLAYQDFLNQQQYPYQQASWMSQMLSGTANPTNTPGMTQGAQTSYAPYSGASPLSQSIGLYAGLNSGAVGNALSGTSSVGGGARGGSTRRFARPKRRSALEHLREVA